MRRIVSSVELSRQEKQKKFWMGGIFIAILLFSTAGFSLMRNNDDGENSVTENGKEFYYQNGLWITEIDEETFGFQYLPSEVENVSVDSDLDVSVYYSQPLYFVGESEGISEVLTNLGRYVLRYQSACLDECEIDAPVKDCSSNLVVFVDGENEVYSEDNCVFISGDAVRGVDAFLYEVLKI